MTGETHGDGKAAPPREPSHTLAALTAGIWCAYAASIAANDALSSPLTAATLYRTVAFASAGFIGAGLCLCLQYGLSRLKGMPLGHMIGILFLLSCTAAIGWTAATRLAIYPLTSAAFQTSGFGAGLMPAWPHQSTITTAFVFLAWSTAALALVFFDRLQTAQVQTTEANARIVELSELLHGVNPAKTQGGFLTEIWVPKRGGSRRLLVQDVVSLTAERDYVRLRAIDGSDHLVRATLHGLHAQLDPTRFVQVHRSAIVNIGHITAADRRSTRGWTITLANGAQVPVGRNHTETLKQLMRADNGSKRTDTETRDRP